ncbi:MAG: ribosome-recycling factor [Phycisphaerae bacterium]
MSDKFDRVIQRLNADLRALPTGRPTNGGPATVNGIVLEDIPAQWRGVPTPIKVFASVMFKGRRTVEITPFVRDDVVAVVKALNEAGIGAAVTSDGTSAFLTLPPLTQDQREDLLAKVTALRRAAKTSVRALWALVKATSGEAGADSPNLAARYEKRIDDLIERKKLEIHVS